MIKYATTLLTAVLLSAPIFNTTVQAQLDAPGWANGQAERVDPGQLLPDAGGGDVSPLSGGTSEPADVAELARGLQYDPLRIFNYVHNHIEYTPYFGLLKGASQTLLERSGNDFDQASLLFSLLIESGYSPVYVYGAMQIPMWDYDAYDLPNWLVTQESAMAVETILVNGGIPYAFSAQNYAFTVDRVWVEVEIDGQTRKLDPAFKRHYGQTGEILSDMMNYSRTALLAQAGGQSGSDYVQNMSESTLFSYLDGLSTNLLSSLNANHANAALDELLGNIGINAESVTNLSTTLRFTSSTVTNWTAIPEQYCHRVTITHGNATPVSQKVSDLNGRRLSITYDGGLQLASGGPVSNLTQIASTISAFDTPTETSNTITLAASLDIATNVPMAGSTTPTNPVSVCAVDFGVVYNNKSPGNIVEGMIDRQTNTSFTRIYRYEVTLANNTSGAYSLTAGGGTTYLDPGQSFDIKARFNGLNKTRGTKTAQVQVRVYYAGEYQGGYDIDLTGRVAEFPSVNFSGFSSVLAHLGTPVTETLTFHNNGSLPLSIPSAMTLSGGTPQRFALVSGYGAGTVNAAGSRAIAWRFDAAQHGVFSTGLSFDFAYDGLTYSMNGALSLQGDARYVPSIAQSSDLDFGIRTFGSTATGTCAVQNTLLPSAPLPTIQILSATITGPDAARFSISSGGQAGTLAAGAMRMIEVNYHTTQTGSHTANVKVAYNYDGLDYYLEIPLSGTTQSGPLATLWLDDEAVVVETGPVSAEASLTIQIDHPYAAYTNTYADATVTYPLKRGGTYAVIYGFGSSETGLLLQRRQRQLQAYREAGLADNSRQVLTESLNIIGLGWMEQTDMATRLINRIAGVRRVQHHRFGLMAQEEGYYVDVKAQLSAGGSIAGIQADSTAAFKAGGLIQSAMEHGILEQMQGTNKPGASTIKLLALANAGSNKIFRVTSGNFTTVTNQLSGYSASELAAFNSFVAAGGSLIIPANGSLTLNQWTGKGYIGHGPQGNSSTVIQMIISGAYGTQNGGYNSYTGNLNVQNSYDEVAMNLYDEAQRQDPASKDPVNLATGDLFFDHIDLALGNGDAPRALALNRHYNNANRNQDGPFGFGWTHSYNIHISEHTQYKAALGQRTPQDAVPMLVAAVATLDLLKSEDNAKGWLTASLVNKWAMDAITENAVSVHIGSRVLTFVKQPDGSYTPPPGVTAKLTRESGLYRLTERYGKQYRFNSAKRLEITQDADGNRMNFTYNSSTNLLSVADCYGRKLTFTYSSNRINQVADTTGRTVSYAYSGGNLTTFTDADNNAWTNAYDSTHRITGVYDPLGQRTATNTYDGLGRVKTQANGRGHLWNFLYTDFENKEINPLGGETIHYFDAARRHTGQSTLAGYRSIVLRDGQDHVTAHIDPKGNMSLARYDSAHNPTNKTDALNKDWFCKYDAESRLVEERDPLGNATRYQYDSKHHPTVISNALGAVVTATYTTNGLPQTVTTTGPGLATARTVTTTYDDYGNPAKVTRTDGGTVTNTWNARGELLVSRDAFGNPTTYTYNKRGLLLSVTDANGNVTSNIYNAAGLKTKIIDPRGNATTFTYTPTYEISKIAYPDGGTVSNSYDMADRLIATTDGEGNTTTFSYDSAGRRIAVTDALGHAVRYALDPNGNTLSTTNAIGHVAYNAVDPLNRVTNTWDQVGSQRRANAAEFDAAGRQAAAVNPIGQRTAFAHDALGRVTTMTRPDLATERNAYDAVGNLLCYTNAKNVAVVKTTYDGMSRPIAQTNALGNDRSWNYDAAGNLLTRTDENGDTIEYSFDEMNRIDGIEYPDATAAGFTYDEAGNVLAATDSDAALSFGYDPMNRVAAVTSSVLSVSSVVNYSHDKNGNRTGLTLPGNKTITYTYDDANRLSTLNLSAFSISAFSFSFDAAGNPTNIVYPNGVTAAYTYDEGGRLTGLTYSKGGTAFINRAYTYNAIGQITKRSISAGLEAVPSDTHQYLRHNAADQLTHVSRMDTYENPERWRDVGPDYDANGAVTNITVAYNGLTLENAFTWDYEGRLTAYSGEHQTNLWFVAPPIPEWLSFKYDALGGRVARTGPTGGEKIHVLDQAAPLKNVLVQRASNGTIERYYIYAPGFGLVAHIDANGTARYYHGDHLGSTIALTDSSGNVTDQFNYTPYGELMARTGTTDTPYTFCGRHGVYWEGGALYHMKARYYRADLARFISMDPLGIAGGVNLYAYANGDPIRFLDALGLCSESFGSSVWSGVKTGTQMALNGVGAVLSAPDAILNWATGTDEYDRMNIALSTPVPFDDYALASLGAVTRGGMVLGALRFADKGEDLMPQRAPEAPLKYHYTTADESLFANGLREGSSVTDKLYSNPLQASQELGIPVPNKVIPIQDAGQFVPAKPSVVQGSNRYLGGGNDFNNLQPVPPSQLLPAQPVGPR